MAILDDKPMSRKVNVDVGRIHYHRWVYVGGKALTLLKPTAMCRCARTSGRAERPGLSARAGRWAACTSSGRLSLPIRPPSSCVPMSATCAWANCARPLPQARGKGIEFVCLNPMNKEDYEAKMAHSSRRVLTT